MNKEEAINFLSGDLRGRFLRYLERCHDHYRNMDTFLSLCKSPEETQELEKFLSIIADGIGKASEIRDSLLGMIRLDTTAASDVAPIIRDIDNWELSFASLDHLQGLHRRNLDFFAKCIDAGVTEDEYDNLFRSAKMANLMDASRKTITQQREMITFKTLSQPRHEQ